MAFGTQRVLLLGVLLGNIRITYLDFWLFPGRTGVTTVLWENGPLRTIISMFVLLLTAVVRQHNAHVCETKTLRKPRKYRCTRKFMFSVPQPGEEIKAMQIGHGVCCDEWKYRLECRQQQFVLFSRYSYFAVSAL